MFCPETLLAAPFPSGGVHVNLSVFNPGFSENTNSHSMIQNPQGGFYRSL